MSGEAKSEFSGAYRNYVLAALTTVYTLNFVDRGLVILLLQDIKQDLRLSDTQLGFLTSSAFGIFYAVMGIPLARWADRSNRVTLTSLAIGLWGLTVMACMFVGNFAQLVVARIGAAVGEAGCSPPTYSLLGDYFKGPAERPRAMAVYWLANPLSALIGFLVGGWLNSIYGWRVTFFVMGAPALLIAVVLKLTVREPRTARIQAGAPRPPAPPISQVLKLLWSRRASRHLSLALILFYTAMFGLAPWYGAFLTRSHGIGTAELGLWLGCIFGLGGIVGILFGGYTAGRLLAFDEAGQLRALAWAVALLVPGYGFFLLLPDKVLALAVLVPITIGFNFILGPAYALMQRLVADEMRATALAVVMLISNLIGMSAGGQVVGVLSDVLTSRLGADGLRYAMLAVSSVALWAGVHFWLASRSVQGDLRAIEAGADDHSIEER